MLFKNVSLYKIKSFKVVRVTGKGGGKYGMGRKRKGPKDSFKDTDSFKTNKLCSNVHFNVFHYLRHLDQNIIWECM